MEALVTRELRNSKHFCTSRVEVMKKPKDMKVKDENDFEWLKQFLPCKWRISEVCQGFCSLLSRTWMYWRTENDHAVISIADVDFASA